MAKEKRSLVAFALDQKRARCKVCNLDKDVYQQIVEARTRRIKQAIIVDWLKQEHDITVTIQEFLLHYSGKHDQS